MVREDLVSSAVDFLRDPSVASSALDKRIAFLQSKNLTQEEIDISLARAGDGSQIPTTPAPAPSQNQYGYQGQQPMRQPAGYGYGYGPCQQGAWGQAPLEPPRRDWRDWFIMATVTSGVSYGLYKVAQRYVLPLISPPTPPQLEADKASIDTSFNRAFALIDQLTTDTAELKEKETQRTQKLDTTLKDVDTVIEDLKAANTRRETESRIIADQIQGLKDQVPKALEGWKANGDAKLEELGQEMQSLKKLLENKVGRSGGPSTPAWKSQPPPTASGNDSLPHSTSNNQGGTTPNTETNGIPPAAPAPGVTASKQESSTPSSNPFERSDRKATIPAWQRVASEKTGPAAGSNTDINRAEAGV